MKRNAYQYLLSWKDSQQRKPLVVRGARQVGKTYLIKTFGKEWFQNTVYLNFEETPSLADFFASSLSPTKIVEKISIYLDQEIVSGKTLLVFDEVQECPNALNSLKYFQEQVSDLHLIAAGSLLGVKLNSNKSFPVGKVSFLEMHPLCFFEFLDAIGKGKLRKLLEDISSVRPLETAFHNELTELLAKYFFVGGMPEAVARYSDERDLKKVRVIHREILDAYSLDFSKHAPSVDVMRISTVWESVPTHLARENKKFIFSAINKSARAREYEHSIQWLVDAGLIHKSYQVSKPTIPLRGAADTRAFKVFLMDAGLLATMAEIPSRTILSNEELFHGYKGAFTENYVAQELVAHGHSNLFYWVSAGTAEVDFLISYDGENFPLEVKSGLGRKKKSLLEYGRKYNPRLLHRASMMNLKLDGNVCNYPLYLLGRFPNL